jgi:hypothetical protein
MQLGRLPLYQLSYSRGKPTIPRVFRAGLALA